MEDNLRQDSFSSRPSFIGGSPPAEPAKEPAAQAGGAAPPPQGVMAAIKAKASALKAKILKPADPNIRPVFEDYYAEKKPLSKWIPKKVQVFYREFVTLFSKVPTTTRGDNKEFYKTQTETFRRLVDEFNTLEKEKASGGSPTAAREEACFMERMHGHTTLDQGALDILDARKRELADRLNILNQGLLGIHKNLVQGHVIGPKTQAYIDKLNIECKYLRDAQKILESDIETLKQQTQETPSVRMLLQEQKTEEAVKAFFTPKTKMQKITEKFNKAEQTIGDELPSSSELESLSRNVDELAKACKQPEKMRELVSSYWVKNMEKALEVERFKSKSSGFAEDFIGDFPKEEARIPFTQITFTWGEDIKKPADPKDAAKAFMDVSYQFLKHTPLQDVPAAIGMRREDIRKVIANQIPASMTEQQSIKKIDYFIQIAEECMKQGDFDTAQSILLALPPHQALPNRSLNSAASAAIQQKALILYKQLPLSIEGTPINHVSTKKLEANLLELRDRILLLSAHPKNLQQIKVLSFQLRQIYSEVTARKVAERAWINDKKIIADKLQRVSDWLKPLQNEPESIGDEDQEAALEQCNLALLSVKETLEAHRSQQGSFSPEERKRLQDWQKVYENIENRLLVVEHNLLSPSPEVSLEATPLLRPSGLALTKVPPPPPLEGDDDSIQVAQMRRTPHVEPQIAEIEAPPPSATEAEQFFDREDTRKEFTTLSNELKKLNENLHLEPDDATLERYQREFNDMQDKLKTLINKCSGQRHLRDLQVELVPLMQQANRVKNLLPPPPPPSEEELAERPASQFTANPQVTIEDDEDVQLHFSPPGVVRVVSLEDTYGTAEMVMPTPHEEIIIPPVQSLRPAQKSSDSFGFTAEGNVAFSKAYTQQSIGSDLEPEQAQGLVFELPSEESTEFARQEIESIKATLASESLVASSSSDAITPALQQLETEWEQDKTDLKQVAPSIDLEALKDQSIRFDLRKSDLRDQISALKDAKEQCQMYQDTASKQPQIDKLRPKLWGDINDTLSGIYQKIDALKQAANEAFPEPAELTFALPQEEGAPPPELSEREQIQDLLQELDRPAIPLRIEDDGAETAALQDLLGYKSASISDEGAEENILPPPDVNEIPPPPSTRKLSMIREEEEEPQPQVAKTTTETPSPAQKAKSGAPKEIQQLQLQSPAKIKNTFHLFMQGKHEAIDETEGSHTQSYSIFGRTVNLHKQVLKDIERSFIAVGTTRIANGATNDSKQRLNWLFTSLQQLFQAHHQTLTDAQMAEMTNLLCVQNLYEPGIAQVQALYFDDTHAVLDNCEYAPQTFAVDIDSKRNEVVFTTEKSYKVVDLTDPDDPKKTRYATAQSEIRIPMDKFLEKGLSNLTQDDFTVNVKVHTSKQEPLVLRATKPAKLALQEWHTTHRLQSEQTATAKKLALLDERIKSSKNPLTSRKLREERAILLDYSNRINAEIALHQASTAGLPPREAVQEATLKKKTPVTPPPSSPENFPDLPESALGKEELDNPPNARQELLAKEQELREGYQTAQEKWTQAEANEKAVFTKASKGEATKEEALEAHRQYQQAFKDVGKAQKALKEVKQQLAELPPPPDELAELLAAEGDDLEALAPQEVPVMTPEELLEARKAAAVKERWAANYEQTSQDLKQAMDKIELTLFSLRKSVTKRKLDTCEALLEQVNALLKGAPNQNEANLKALKDIYDSARRDWEWLNAEYLAIPLPKELADVTLTQNFEADLRDMAKIRTLVTEHSSLFDPAKIKTLIDPKSTTKTAQTLERELAAVFKDIDLRQYTDNINKSKLETDNSQFRTAHAFVRSLGVIYSNLSAAIVNEITAEEADSIKKMNYFLSLAKKCLDQNNIFAAQCILNALQTPEVRTKCKQIKGYDTQLAKAKDLFKTTEAAQRKLEPEKFPESIIAQLNELKKIKQDIELAKQANDLDAEVLLQDAYNRMNDQCRIDTCNFLNNRFQTSKTKAIPMLTGIGFKLESGDLYFKNQYLMELAIIQNNLK